jgi:hypothetical protein
MSNYFNRSYGGVTKPTYKYDPNVDTFLLRFNIPGNQIISHKFNKLEPLETVVLQLKYNLKYKGGLVLILPPSTIINCTLDTPIIQCGIMSNQTITVAKA